MHGSPYYDYITQGRVDGHSGLLLCKAMYDHTRMPLCSELKKALGEHLIVHYYIL